MVAGEQFEWKEKPGDLISRVSPSLSVLRRGERLPVRTRFTENYTVRRRINVTKSSTASAFN